MMTSLHDNLVVLFQQALAAAYPAEQTALATLTPDIMPATRVDFGHYQCNSAMKLARILRTNPRAIATAWQAQLAHHTDFTVTIAGPGFLNIQYTPAALSTYLTQRLQDPRLGVPLSSRQRIVVDYSSPNIAKEMHVGHLRSTIIGDALARLFTFLGHDVLRLNHVGDWGTQFGMLICYIQDAHIDLTTATLPHLMGWYRAAKERFDADPQFKKRAQACVVDLQHKKPEIFSAWQKICDISAQSYATIYQRLGVAQLELRGESFYNDQLPDVIADLATQNLLTTSDGARCVFLAGFQNRHGDPLPLIVQKQDGGYNYATTDLAALKHRAQVEKADRIIYVTDSGQQQHFAMVFAVAQAAGYLGTTHVSHVPFGLVLKPDGKKFKTRSGDTEKLIDLLNAAIHKARQELTARHPDLTEAELDEMSHKLGIGAVKYADLATNRISDYIFSYDKMLQFEGNTVIFLLYAYVRAQSILRKTTTTATEVVLETTEEQALALQLLRFPEALNAMYQELLPNRLTDYLFQLAEKFHTFFHACRVDGHVHEGSRRLICEQVAKTIACGLDLLGITTVESM